MGNSNIEWTEHSWNPIVGCSILSPGCTNCYAMQMAARIEAMNREARETEHASGKRRHVAGHYDSTTKTVNGKPVWTGKLALAGDNIVLAPLKRKNPTTYFVNSMGDLFHENVPDEWIDKVFAVMALCPQHTFQVLTKRAERMRQWFANVDRADHIGLTMLTIVDRIPHGHRRVPWPLPNVWLGVSTERQQEADERIPQLLQTPAAVRFISAEPLLGPIDLTRLCGSTLDSLSGHDFEAIGDIRDAGDLSKTKHPPSLDWVIVGGESGPGARPMHPDWARQLRDQCAATGTKFFFKQWGMWAPVEEPASQTQEDEELRNTGEMLDGQYMRLVGKKAAGRLLDGVEHNGMPSAQARRAA